MNNTKIKVIDLQNNQELQIKLNISEYIENGVIEINFSNVKNKTPDEYELSNITVDLQGVILFGVEKSFEWTFYGLKLDDVLVFNEKGFLVEIEKHNKIT